MRHISVGVAFAAQVAAGEAATAGREFIASAQERPSHPVATVVLTDRCERACWLSERVAEEARFFLRQVETESEQVVDQKWLKTMEESDV